MKQKILNAGPFTVLYENGFLRYVRYGNQEIVRMLYFALRDENWGTYEPFIEDESLDIQSNSFAIRYTCYHKISGDHIFRWNVMINASPTGEIIFEIHGEALTDLKRNRAGFCVLHPIRETAGQPCKIIHPDGSISNSTFPEFVSPENPYKNIKKLHWVIDNNGFELHFEGEVFETEDQRNWTDASFKTFCTPLDLPFPVSLKRGDTVNQKVIFRSQKNLPRVVEQKIESPKEVGQNYKLPAIGIGASTETDELSPKAITLLRELKLSHYRIEVHPLTDGWVSKFSIDCQNAIALNLPLEIALHLTDQFANELEAFIILALQNRIRIKSILLFSANKLVTDQALIDYVPILKKQLPNVLYGAGTDYNFTELNRNHVNANNLDFIIFSIHPQQHAIDDLSVLETIEAQADVVKSAQNTYMHLPIHISPLTLKMRFNPYATSQQSKIQTNSEKADRRQTTSFASDWTEKSIWQLALAGASSVTVYQTVGMQGIMSFEGEVYPVYDILKKIIA